MNVDVKNAFERVIRICGKECINIFLEDICNFIMYISVENAKERFSNFCKTYSNRSLKTVVNSDKSKKYVSKLLERALTAEARQAIVYFFIVLGKSFLLSGTDKKSVNKDKYVEAVQDMQVYVRQPLDQLQPDVVQDKPLEQQKEEVLQETIEEVIEPEEKLEDLLEQLHTLIGLENVKSEVEEIINVIKVQEKAKEYGLKKSPISLHLVFFGKPGTGKTTVARLLSKIYKSLGVLSSGQLVEVDRSQLVGGYVGQTAIKTQEVIDKAMGGILFIDEAYTLTRGKGTNDFGQEAVDTLLKAMEDHRDDFVVIVAGYEELMKEFVNSNPGLKSRFNTFIKFEDYTPEQLLDIFMLHCQEFIVSPECKEFLLNYFTEMYTHQDEGYANGRDVRNYFEQVKRVQANRIAPIIDTITKEQILTLEVSDLEGAAAKKHKL